MSKTRRESGDRNDKRVAKRDMRDAFGEVIDRVVEMATKCDVGDTFWQVVN
jgi:hypothetical protein